jgi:hypothetical protein
MPRSRTVANFDTAANPSVLSNNEPRRCFPIVTQAGLVFVRRTVSATWENRQLACRPEIGLACD